VAVDANGGIVSVMQKACPLWQGLDKLSVAFEELAEKMPLCDARTHAVTMTGELVDLFPDRETGVRTLIAMARRSCDSRLLIFAGPQGLLTADEVGAEQLPLIASANWLASGLWLAQCFDEGLLIDVGSTTTDLLPFAAGRVLTRGYTDYERLRYDELVYTGIVRTPLSAIAGRIPFRGEWIGLMNERFATAADIYRLVGELPEHADQFPAADGGTKDALGSARRLARMLGLNQESSPAESWISLARSFRERQIARLAAAVELQLSRGVLGSRASLIGAGAGRFLVEAIAQRLDRDYVDLFGIFPVARGNSDFSVADCLPAAAVAHLARRHRWSD
jgi:probable H4MPT-linked C1 transfer pathway protein